MDSFRDWKHVIVMKWKINFILDKIEGEPLRRLRFRLRWSQNIVAFNLGFKIDPSKWSPDTQRCKINTTHGDKSIPASVINREINRYELITESIFNKLNERGIIPKKEYIKEEILKEIRGIDPIDKTDNLLEAFDVFTKEMGTENSWTEATYEKFRALKGHIINFDEKISFNSLDKSKLTLFVKFLINHEDIKNTTAEKQLSFLKWFLRWAKQKNYQVNDDFEKFKPKLKKTDKKVIFLDWDELMTVYNFNLQNDKKRLEKIKDIFLFSCFTSLRFSDVQFLKKSDIYKDYMLVTTIKTNDTVKIELNQYSKSILEKYINLNINGEYVFPEISNQKMNKYLKELIELCGIDKPVTITYYKGNKRFDQIYPKYKLIGTHCGRRTFICNALMLGIPPEIVMKWTGHSSYKSMQPYIDIADKAKRDAMNLFNR